MAAPRTTAQRYNDGMAETTDHHRQATDIRNARVAQGEPVADLAAVNTQITKKAEIVDLTHDNDETDEGQELSRQIQAEIDAIFKQTKIQSVLNENEVNQDIVDYIGGLLDGDEELALLLRDKFTTVGTTVERRREKTGSAIEQEVEEAKRKITEKTRQIAALEKRNRADRKKAREEREAARLDREAKEAAQEKVANMEYEMSTNAPVLGAVDEDDEEEQAAKEHVIELGIFGEEFPQTWSTLENIVQHIIGSTVTIKNEAVQQAVADMGAQVKKATVAADKSKTKLTETKATVKELRAELKAEKKRAYEAEAKHKLAMADHKIDIANHQNASANLQNARTENEKLKEDIEAKETRIEDLRAKLTKAQTTLLEEAKTHGGDVAEWIGKHNAEEVLKDEYQGQRDELRVENIKLKRDLAARQGEVEQLKIEKTTAATRLISADENITRLEGELSETKKELKDIQDKLEKLKLLRESDSTRRNEAVQAAIQEREQLRVQMQSDKDDAVRDERATTAAERQAVEEMRGQLGDMREQRDNFERQYLDATSRENTLKLELKHANGEIERQSNEVARLEQTLFERNDRISELEGQIAGFKEQVEGTNTEGLATNAELTSVRQQLANTQDDRNNLRITLAERDRVLQLWREIVFHQSMSDTNFLQRDIPAILDHLQTCLSQPWNVTTADIKRSAQHWLSFVDDNSKVPFIPGNVPAYGWYLFLQATIHPQDLDINRLRYLISLLETRDYPSQVLGYLQAALEQLASSAIDADHLTFAQSDFFVRGCEFLFMTLYPGRSLEKIKALWLKTVDRLSLDIVMSSIGQWIGCQIDNVAATRGQFFLDQVKAMHHLELTHDTVIAADAEDKRVFVATPGEIIHIRTLDDIDFNIDAYQFVWTIAVEGFPALSLPMNGANMTAMAAALPGFDLTRWMR
jgi:hypothetical protein